MDLQPYFDRIGFKDEARADLATLRDLHRAHLQAIPYENLDVQLGRPLTPDPAAAFDKIVARGRGGWCYEMNGVFGLVLRELGFKVMRMAGAAMRELMGDIVIGNHLVLLVEIDGEPWIADVGFGDGALEPFPLKAAPLAFGGYSFRLEAMDEGWWRFHNHEGAAGRPLRVAAVRGGLPLRPEPDRPALSRRADPAASRPHPAARHAGRRRRRADRDAAGAGGDPR